MWEITKTSRHQTLVESPWFEPRFGQHHDGGPSLDGDKVAPVIQLVWLFGERLAKMKFPGKANPIKDCTYAELEFEHFMSSADKENPRHELWVCFSDAPLLIADKLRCRAAIKVELAPDFTPTSAAVHLPPDTHDLDDDLEIVSLIANIMRKRGKNIPTDAALHLSSGTLTQEHAPIPFRPSNQEVAQLGEMLQQIGYTDPRARFWQCVGFSASLEQR